MALLINEIGSSVFEEVTARFDGPNIIVLAVDGTEHWLGHPEAEEVIAVLQWALKNQREVVK